MITELNRNNNTWVRIFKIDMVGLHPDQTDEEYFVTQLDIIANQQYTQGYCLRGVTHFSAGWILIFIPQKPF